MRKRLAAVSVEVQDAVLAILLTAVSLVTVIVADGQDLDPHEHVPALAIVLLCLENLPLAVRRRHPVVVWAVTGVAASLYGVGSYVDPPLPFGALVGVYTVAAHTQRRTAVRAGVVTALAVAVSQSTHWTDADIADWFTSFVTVGSAWLLGAYTAQIGARAREQARQAAADERLRIARELHDVAAHQVSVIAVQAEAGQALLPAQPEQAGAVLATIGIQARDALTELRRVLGVLRNEHGPSDGTPAPRAPQPGLAALEPLVTQVRRAGLPVDLVLEGDRRPLPEGVDLSAYRIVQEGLTNVLKHAGPAQAEVRVRYGAQSLDIEIRDDGRGASGANGAGDGHGLTGMRERVQLLGGELDAGNRDTGTGFVVRARLPL